MRPGGQYCGDRQPGDQGSDPLGPTPSDWGAQTLVTPGGGPVKLRDQTWLALTPGMRLGFHLEDRAPRWEAISE